MFDSNSPIGMIGVGHLGSAIVRKLREAGRTFVVYDKAETAMRNIAGPGVQPASSAREVADRAEIVVVCLASVSSSLEVAEEVSGGSAVRHYMEMSSLPPQAMLDIARPLAARGIGVCDAPISGGPPVVASGGTVLMLAGPPETTSIAAELLAPIAGRTFFVGTKLGMAQTCKLVNNAISLSLMILSSEAVVTGVKAGIDPSMLIEIINSGSGMNRATLQKFPGYVLKRRFEYGGRLGMVPKDLNAYLDEARRLGSPSPLVATAEQIFQQAIAVVGGDEDMTAVVKLFESWSGVEVGSRDTNAD